MPRTYRAVLTITVDDSWTQSDVEDQVNEASHEMLCDGVENASFSELQMEEL